MVWGFGVMLVALWVQGSVVARDSEVEVAVWSGERWLPEHDVEVVRVVVARAGECYLL